MILNSSTTATSTLRVYRHILRECSYLPPAVRPTVASTIQTRFRRNRKNGVLSPRHRRRAATTLRTLRAANAGDKRAMEGLIDRAFGRSGNKRRELMSDFVKAQGPNDSKALESMLSSTDETKYASPYVEVKASAQGQRKQKPKFYEKWDQPKLLQFIKSQQQQQRDTRGTTSWPGSEIRNLDPNQFVPKTNIWGKPPVEFLVRTKRAHWWKKNAEKMMPPLVRGEWELLKRLSEGSQDESEWKIPERRSPGVLVDANQAEEQALSPWRWRDYALRSVAYAERAKSFSQSRRSGEIDDGPYGRRNTGQLLSARWFRRAYNRTWQLTPTMHQDPNTLKYAFAWGSAPSRYTTPREEQLEIFQGVNNKGQGSSAKG